MKPDLPTDDKGPGAGRPRDPRIDAAILAATAELVVEVGYTNLTMTAIAERAGTTKTALYRRWSSKAELVHEAVFPAAPTALTVAAEQPTSDIAADVYAMIAATRDIFTSPLARAALPGLIADMVADAELNARVMGRFAGAFDAVRDRVAEGVERGEVHREVNADRLVEVIGGTTLMAMLLEPDKPLGDDWVEQTSAIVLRGVGGW